jgi:tRNA-dihydrouridine synthase
VLRGEKPSTVSTEERLTTATEHLREYARVFGEHAAAKEMKRHLVRHIKALPGASSLRKSIFEARTVAELEAILSACRDGGAP